MAKNNVSTVIAGSNLGGIAAGQINISEDSESKRQRAQTIKAWLSPLAFWQKQENVYSEHHPGTGGWILESDQFRNWMNGTPANLWCHGPPGSGKTVLASIVVNHLRTRFLNDPEVGVAFVYCEWKNRGILSVANLLASIWSQFTIDEAVTSEAEYLYDQHTKFSTTPRQHEIISILEREVDRFSSVYIVVDALNELTEENSHTSAFIGALNMLAQSKKTRVHILATSNIEQSSLEKPGIIHITAKRDDIELFVRDTILGGVSYSNDLSQIIKDDPELQRQIVRQIRINADGLFLLARLSMDSLKYKTSLQTLIDAVESLPSSIHQQYKERLDRINHQDPDHRNFALRILGWLTHAVRPMKVQELRHALAVRQGNKAIATRDLDMEDLFVPCCHGLVAIEQETQIIRLIHHTAQQYLDDDRLPMFSEIQAQILGTCLTYLSFSEFERGRCTFQSFDNVWEVNEVANGKRIAKRRFLPDRLSKFPFLHYAASSWGWHATGDVGLSHEKKILTFLQSPMLLESAAQVQDSDLLYTWPLSEENTKSIRTHLPLIVSGSFGLGRIMSILLDKLEGFDVNVTYGSKKSTLLHKAVEAGSLALTRVLLDAGADIKLPEPDSIISGKRSILYKAIAHGHDAIVEALLSQGSDVQVEESAIYCATFCESETAIQFIVNRSSDGAERAERLHQILLHAASLGKVSVIDLALRLGANVSAKDTNGQTALFVAVEHGRSDAVDVLLKAGSSTTERDASSKSLLQVAIGTHQIIQERLRYIWAYGCTYERIPELSNGPCSLLEPIAPEARFMEDLDIWLEDCTAKELYESREFRRDVVYEDSLHIQVMEKILGCGGDVNEKNSEGQSILHLAACSTLKRARRFIKFSIKFSKSKLVMDPTDNNGRTPLHYAAARGKTDIMDLLLSHGAGIDLVDQKKATTLHFSVLSPGCTRHTIKRCRDLIHNQDDLCRTALHYAALVEEPNMKVRDILLGAGVRPDTVDLRGRTAQYYYDAHEDISSESHKDQGFEFPEDESFESHEDESSGFPGGGGFESHEDENSESPEDENSESPEDENFQSHEQSSFLYTMMCQCSYELNDGALYSAIDNSNYYGQRYGVHFFRQIKENRSALADKEKAWTVVSNSDDEDFVP